MNQALQRLVYAGALAVMAGALVCLAPAASPAISNLKSQISKRTNAPPPLPPRPATSNLKSQIAKLAVAPKPPPTTNALPSWRAADNAAAYFLYYGTNSGLYTTRVPCGTNLNARVTVRVDTAYYWTVSAANRAGVESVLAPEISWMLPGHTNIAPGFLQFLATKNGVYAIDGSSNLVQWTPLFTQSVTNSKVITFTEAPMPGKRYWKIKSPK